MKVEETVFNGLKIIEAFNPKDVRGQFVKFYNESFLKENGILFDLKESYFSVSKKNVIRGMHFQIPPKDHAKIVFVSFGKINDVCVDLRKGSSTYKQVFSFELNDENNFAIYIPSGFAHGFKTISEKAIVHYMQSSEYSSFHDSGIKWNSIPYDWKITQAIVSKRDSNLTDFNEFLINQNFF